MLSQVACSVPITTLRNGILPALSTASLGPFEEHGLLGARPLVQRKIDGRAPNFFHFRSYSSSTTTIQHRNELTQKYLDSPLPRSSRHWACAFRKLPIMSVPAFSDIAKTSNDAGSPSDSIISAKYADESIDSCSTRTSITPLLVCLHECCSYNSTS